MISTDRRCVVYAALKLLAIAVFLAIGVISTILYIRFTPIFEPLSLSFGEPKIFPPGLTTLLFASVHFEVAMNLHNSNPYGVSMIKSFGKILRVQPLPEAISAVAKDNGAYPECGGILIPASVISTESTTSIMMSAWIDADNITQLQDWFYEFGNASTVELWFILPKLTGEAKPNLIITDMVVAFDISIACSAKFDGTTFQMKGDVRCSEDVYGLMRDEPGKLSPPSLDDLNTRKDAILFSLMIFGYLFGTAGLALFVMGLQGGLKRAGPSSAALNSYRDNTDPTVIGSMNGVIDEPVPYVYKEPVPKE